MGVTGSKMRGKNVKKLKICLKNCHDFVSTHEKNLKFSQNKLHSMWKKCGKC